MDRREQRRESLRAFLEQRPNLSMLWIVSVLKDCAVKEFDEHVSALEPTHVVYVHNICEHAQCEFMYRSPFILNHIRAVPN